MRPPPSVSAEVLWAPSWGPFVISGQVVRFGLVVSGGVLDRSAVLVDAGYLLAAGGLLTCGTSHRSELACDFERTVIDLARFTREHTPGTPTLRTYWYDAAPDGVPTADHLRIGGFAHVKVRLGRPIQGEQKGVDALIYRDLMTLARERAISRAHLLSGDEDLRKGVVAHRTWACR